MLLSNSNASEMITAIHVWIDAGGLEISFDTTEEMVADEMETQRRKLREISKTLDVQHQLLRLIIQVRY